MTEDQVKKLAEKISSYRTIDAKGRQEFLFDEQELFDFAWQIIEFDRARPWVKTYTGGKPRYTMKEPND
jgi:hypothetical protein